MRNKIQSQKLQKLKLNSLTQIKNNIIRHLALEEIELSEHYRLNGWTSQEFSLFQKQRHHHLEIDRKNIRLIQKLKEVQTHRSSHSQPAYTQNSKIFNDRIFTFDQYRQQKEKKSKRKNIKENSSLPILDIFREKKKQIMNKKKKLENKEQQLIVCTTIAAARYEVEEQKPRSPHKEKNYGCRIQRRSKTEEKEKKSSQYSFRTLSPWAEQHYIIFDVHQE